jgi:hypothetical protein
METYIYKCTSNGLQNSYKEITMETIRYISVLCELTDPIQGTSVKNYSNIYYDVNYERPLTIIVHLCIKKRLL